MVPKPSGGGYWRPLSSPLLSNVPPVRRRRPLVAVRNTWPSEGRTLFVPSLTVPKRTVAPASMASMLPSAKESPAVVTPTALSTTVPPRT